MQHDVPRGKWELRAPANVIARLRTEPEFHRALILARIIDALKFAVSAMTRAQNDPSSHADRQRVGVILYLAAVLNELYDLRKAAPRLFQDSALLREVSAVLDERKPDPEIAAAMGRLRNQAVSHFDPDVAAAASQRLPSQGLTFATGLGSDRLNMSYDLADFITLAQAFDLTERYSELHGSAMRLLDSIGSLAIHLLDRAEDALIQWSLTNGFSFVDLEGNPEVR